MNAEPARNGNTSEAVPALLTVEEAASVLRIGRTKAYELARAYRNTDGASGIPVIELGRILRVPRVRLEEAFGIEVSAEAIRAGGEAPADEKPASTPPRANGRSRPGATHRRVAGQASLPLEDR